MATKYWIKLYHEILDDPKMGRLRVALRWRFIECLLVAGENGHDGFLPDTKDLAWRLRCDAEKLETDLVELANTGLLNRVDGQWLVVKFKQRQEPSKAALRMRSYRQRKKEAKKETEEETYTDTDTYRARNALRNGNVTPPPKPPPDAYHEMRAVWASRFALKSQPRPDNKTLQGKVKTRMKSKHFRDNWRAALERSGASPLLARSGWFDFGWFVANDNNYEKCLNGNYDDKSGKPLPAPEPARPGGRY